MSHFTEAIQKRISLIDEHSSRRGNTSVITNDTYGFVQNWFVQVKEEHPLSVGNSVIFARLVGIRLCEDNRLLVIYTRRANYSSSRAFLLY